MWSVLEYPHDFIKSLKNEYIEFYYNLIYNEGKFRTL